MIGLRRDPTDLRDQIYSPSLHVLKPQADPVGFLADICPKDGCPPYPKRNQGDTGLCVGFALANLIDIHRMRAAASDLEQAAASAARLAAMNTKVSARMIYEVARRIEGRSDGTEEGIQSLRSAVKGFYHHGCCPETLWPDLDDPDAPYGEDQETARADAARAVTLGAYFRVLPILNHYHSALVEADGILVSAQIHRGWEAPHLRDPKAAADIAGMIPPSNDELGAHAFVIIGYTAEGFLVLNSWGEAWGGYRGRPCIALWRYADWARNVMDAWVLRLGVSAPGAFQWSIGDQGISFGSLDLPVGSTACHHLEGHFAHLDDGVHVESGSYASSRASVARVTAMLASRAPQSGGRVLLTIGGSLLGLKDAFDVEARRRQHVDDIPNLFPYSLLWCADLIESATPVLTHMFSTAVARVGPHSAALNTEIEKVTAGIGRAFWREVKRAAKTAGTHLGEGSDGAAAELFDRFAATGAPLHLLVDGAGVLLLAEYLYSLQEEDLDDPVEADRRANLSRQFLDAVASIDLIAPTIEAPDFIQAFNPLIARLKQKGTDRATLWVPSAEFEDRLSIDHYAGSMLDLVLYGFERRPREASFVGMSRKRSKIGRLLRGKRALDGLRVLDIQPHIPDRRRYEYHEVSLNPNCIAEILHNVAGFGTSSRMT